MKTSILLVGLLAGLGQDKDPDQVRITVDLQDVTMGEAIEAFSRLSGVPIELDDAARKELDLGRKLGIKMQDISLTSGLKLLLVRTNMDVRTVDRKKVLITPKGE